MKSFGLGIIRYGFDELKQKLSLVAAQSVNSSKQSAVFQFLLGILHEEIGHGNVQSIADIGQSFHGRILIAKFDIPQMALCQSGFVGKFRRCESFQISEKYNSFGSITFLMG